MAEQFDAIVVGAGPVGALAALTVASGRRSVLLLERGASPGATGSTAGLLRGGELTRLLPGSTLPATERTIVEERVVLLDALGGVSFEFRDHSRGAGAPTVRSALAGPLAQQLAALAASAGAVVRTGEPVEVTPSASGPGIRVGGGDVAAPVVIFTDPVSPPRRAKGSGGPGDEHRVEALYRLPSRSIERRLGVGPGEGASLECLLPFGGPSGHHAGFLVPGTDCLAVGVTAGPGTPAEANRAFDAFTSHPSIALLLAGAELIGRHAYRRSFPPPTAGAVGGEGYLLAGDCLGLDDPSGAFSPGWAWSLESGRAAGEVAVAGGGRLAQAYASALRQHGVAPAMRLGRELHDTLQRNPRLHGSYPRAMGQALHELMSETGARKQSVVRTMRAVRRASKIGWGSLAGDALSFGRVL
jgi:electron transfer flavoprotein-quinone oxidoreductase